MMNHRKKTKKELIKELQELQQEYNSLITSYQKDVTDHKLAKEGLRECEEVYRLLFENSGEAFLLTNPDGSIYSANPEACRIFGMGEDEICKLGRNGVVELDDPRLEPALNERKKTGKFKGELTLLRKNGIKFPAEVTSTIFIDASGNERTSMVIRDISKRKLVEKELNLQSEIMKNITEGVYLVRLNDETIVFTNQKFDEMFGYEYGEMIGKHVSVVNAPTDKSPEETKQEIIDNIRRSGEWHGEILNIKKNGDQFWSYANVSMFDHPIYGIVYLSVHSDITERKQTEMTLKNLLSLTEATLESIHNGILVISNKRTVIRTNAKLAEMWRIPADIISSGDDKTLLENVIGQLSDPDAFILKVEELYEKPEAESFDLIYFKDGRIFERISKPMYLGGEPKARVWSFLDITECKLAEEALHLEKENFRHSLDDSPFGVRIATIEGNTIYTNKTLLNFYGYDSLEELQQVPLKERYTPESYTLAQKRKYLRKRGDFNATDYEISIVRKNGEIRHLQVFRKEVLWDGIQLFQVIYNNITERKKAEEDTIKSKKLLEDLHKHLNEIRENERALIAREIHDQIGQSLTALKLDLNMLHKDIDSNPKTVAKLESMVELVSNTIKDVQRISSDLRPGILDELGLVSAIEWYCDEFEKRTNIRCNLRLDDSDYSDSQINLTLFRVLQEILTNVIRHARASSVSIKLRQLNKGTTMTVKDDGIGIPEEKIRSGKSLGLIGMRERLKQFNGTIDVSSKKNFGTKLVIFIPHK